MNRRALGWGLALVVCVTFWACLYMGLRAVVG